MANKKSRLEKGLGDAIKNLQNLVILVFVRACIYPSFLS